MINCVVIEDDFAWKTKILAMLDALDIAVQGVATDVASGVELLQKVSPDIVIADVMLGKERVFDIYASDPAFCKLPTVFVTQSDTEIDYKNAKKVLNHLYIVKPVHKLTLKSAIDNLCKIKLPKAVNDGLTIKGKFNQKVVVPFEKIIYINQVQHYCNIYTQQQHFTIKKSLVNVIKDLDDRFMQVHRSYCINKAFIENFSVGLENIKVKGVEIPIGNSFKDALKELIGEEFSVK